MANKPVSVIGLIIILILILILPSCRAEAPSSISSDSETEEPSSLLSAPDPAKFGTTESDVIYSMVDGVELKMDIHYPKVAATNAVPAVVHFHGIGGTKGLMPESHELINRGYLVVSVDFRQPPDYKFPAFIEDGKCAIRFLRENASFYGIDPDRIGVWGYSLGGYIVNMLGTADQSAGFEGSGGYQEQSSRVMAVVDIFGPSDLTPGLNEENPVGLFMLLGTDDPQTVINSSPVTYISEDDPPFLIIHCAQDEVVPLEGAQGLFDRLNSVGVPARLIVVENCGHGFTDVGGGEFSPTRDEITQMIADFFDEYLK